jgi:hypothetical protein
MLRPIRPNPFMPILIAIENLLSNFSDNKFEFIKIYHRWLFLAIKSGPAEQASGKTVHFFKKWARHQGQSLSPVSATFGFLRAHFL